MGAALFKVILIIAQSSTVVKRFLEYLEYPISRRKLSLERTPCVFEFPGGIIATGLLQALSR